MKQIKRSSPLVYRIILACLLVLIGSGCNDSGISQYSDQQTMPTSSPEALVFPGSEDAAIRFVGALNAKDYMTVYALLDKPSKGRLQDPAKLSSLYQDTLNTTTGISVTYSVVSGTSKAGNLATTRIGAHWKTILFGELLTTSTLTMSVESAKWQIEWTKDLVFPGMSTAILALQRDLPQRGAIYAFDGSPLAAQGESMTLGIRQTEINSASEEQAILKALSKLTGMSINTIKGRYKDQPVEWWIPIADVDAETLANNAALIEPYPAIIAKAHTARTYPQGALAPHVVGYVGAIPTQAIDAYRLRGYAGNEIVGLSGVEGYLDSILGGTPGGSLQLITPNGDISEVAHKPFIPGQDVTLSISPTVQISVQNILGSRKGAAIIMNPQNGYIIAMASYPAFDNSSFNQSGGDASRSTLMKNPVQPLLNRATQGTYPAGSTFKMVTMAAGMGEGVTSPKDAFSDPGYWDGLGNRYRKTCWLRSGHGRITLQDGLTASCDTVFYTVGKRLDDKGSSLLAQYGKLFGFGTPTGIELTEEASGIMPDPDWKKAHIGEVWTPGDTVNLSIGQGYMLATPLQVNQMTAAIANGGILIRPHVVAAYGGNASVSPQVVERTEVRKLPITAEGLQAIQTGMAGVTTNARIGTTTWRFTSFDYYMLDGSIVSGKTLSGTMKTIATRFAVAGKSGTAQAPGATDKPFAWFTAYAPADNPQIAVTVMLEFAGEGSVVAAPLVRQMIEAYFGLPISPLPKDIQVTD